MQERPILSRSTNSKSHLHTTAKTIKRNVVRNSAPLMSPDADATPEEDSVTRPVKQTIHAI